MYSFERKDVYSNDHANSIWKKCKERNIVEDFMSLSIEDYLTDPEKMMLKKSIFELNRGISPLVNNQRDRLSSKGKTHREYWCEYYQLVYWNDNFPYGIGISSYERHMKLMRRRHRDVKNRTLRPPNFKSIKPIGLRKIKSYLDCETKEIEKPVVIGRTLILPMIPLKNERSMDLKECINFTYLNKFDNVQVPAMFMLKHDYLISDSNYKFGSFYWVLYELERNGLSGYKNVTEYFETFHVICFNLFLAPMRDCYIEVIMKFLIAFQLGHPNIYVKDVSGRGYNVYEKYSFYQELRSSRIDISVK